MGKTNFNMQLTDTEKEIMDFVTDVIFEGTYSKAQLVLDFFKEKAIDYLGLPEEAMGLYDEVLLSSLKKHKFDNDVDMVGMVGIDKFKAFISDYKSKNADNDASYFEKCLAEYERLQNGGQSKELFEEV